MSKTRETDRATEWSIVLNKPVETTTGFTLETIHRKLKSEYVFVASILHDRDVDDNDALKTLHIHAVIKTPRKRKSTLIGDLEELLGLPQEVISVEKCKSLRASVRYLTHADDEEKEQYYPFEVLCSDKDFYESCLIDRLTFVSEEQLIEIVRAEKTTSKILLRIGAENYKKYALIIRDLQKEIW